MLWIIICVDRPGAEALRLEHLESHRQYLSSQADRLFFSGPQMTDDASRQTGSVFMVKAESRDDARGFIEAEDFFRAGVFESVVIRRIRRGRLDPALAE